MHRPSVVWFIDQTNFNHGNQTKDLDWIRSYSERFTDVMFHAKIWQSIKATFFKGSWRKNKGIILHNLPFGAKHHSTAALNTPPNDPHMVRSRLEGGTYGFYDDHLDECPFPENQHVTKIYEGVKAWHDQTGLAPSTYYHGASAPTLGRMTEVTTSVGMFDWTVNSSRKGLIERGLKFQTEHPDKQYAQGWLPLPSLGSYENSLAYAVDHIAAWVVLSRELRIPPVLFIQISPYDFANYPLRTRLFQFLTEARKTVGV